MATLSGSELKQLSESVDSCKATWILAGYRRRPQGPLSATLQGALGFFDWRLHGQVSQLVQKGQPRKGGIAMIPSRGRLGQSSLLVYGLNGAPDTVEIVKALRNLRAERLSLAGSTWPEGTADKLQKALNKAGIKCELLKEAPGG